MPRFRPDNEICVPQIWLSDFLLTALVRKRAGRFAGRLARRLAFAAARLFLFLFKAALHNRFDMLHINLLIRVYCKLPHRRKHPAGAPL